MREGPDDCDSVTPQSLVDVRDEVFAALRDTDRRLVLYYLREHGSASVEELADVVTGWSSAGSRGMALPADRDDVATALRHRHLPVLEEAGLVTRDDSTGRVLFDVASAAVEALVTWACREEGAERSP